MSEAVVDSREVLENIRFILEDHVEDDDSLEVFNRVIDLAKKRIDDYGLLKTENEILKINSKSKWIDVKDRLPDANDDYLVTVHNLEDDSVYVSHWKYNIHTGWDFLLKEEIIAWMDKPLPFGLEEKKDSDSKYEEPKARLEMARVKNHFTVNSDGYFIKIRKGTRVIIDHATREIYGITDAVTMEILKGIVLEKE